MSKADDVFYPIPGRWFWGSACQYIRVSDPGTYDPLHWPGHREGT